MKNLGCKVLKIICNPLIMSSINKKGLIIINPLFIAPLKINDKLI